MLKAYKYRLNPTSEQTSLIERTFGSTRFIYNRALRTKIEAYQYTWLNEVSSECLQRSIRNLDQAFTRFFREKKGFPKFKSKRGSRRSFKNILNVRIDFDNNRIKLPKSGWVRSCSWARTSGCGTSIAE